MNKPFPKTLYVLEPIDEKEEFDSFTDIDSLEQGDVVAVYELKYIAEVTKVTTTQLNTTGEKANDN